MEHFLGTWNKHTHTYIQIICTSKSTDYVSSTSFFINEQVLSSIWELLVTTTVCMPLVHHWGYYALLFLLWFIGITAECISYFPPMEACMVLSSTMKDGLWGRKLLVQRASYPQLVMSHLRGKPTTTTLPNSVIPNYSLFVLIPTEKYSPHPSSTKLLFGAAREQERKPQLVKSSNVYVYKMLMNPRLRDLCQWRGRTW